MDTLGRLLLLAALLLAPAEAQQGRTGVPSAARVGAAAGAGVGSPLPPFLLGETEVRRRVKGWGERVLPRAGLPPQHPSLRVPQAQAKALSKL